MAIFGDFLPKFPYLLNDVLNQGVSKDVLALHFYDSINFYLRNFLCMLQRKEFGLWRQKGLDLNQGLNIDLHF